MREPDLASFFTPSILLTSPGLDQNCLMSEMFSFSGRLWFWLSWCPGGSLLRPITLSSPHAHRHISVLWGKLTKHKATPVLYQLSSRYESSTVSFLHHCTINSKHFLNRLYNFRTKVQQWSITGDKYNNSNDNMLSGHSHKEFLNTFNGKLSRLRWAACADANRFSQICAAFRI